MINAFLIRDVRSCRYTMGVFIIDGIKFYTIEKPWLNNKRNKSCIPPGRYLCRFMRRSSSGKYKNCYHLINVRNRSGILLHNGNTVDHTKGCILLGKSRGFLGGARAVLSSRSAMKKLVRITKKKDFYLEVVGG